MPTLIGVFFLVAALACFFRKDESLFALAIFSSIFQGASLTSGGASGLQPYYLIVIAFIMQTALRNVGQHPDRRFKGSTALIVFGVIAVVSAFTLPFLFAGVPIYDKSIGIDDGLFFRPPLAFSFSNVVQAAFLIINIAFVMCAAIRVSGQHLPIRAFRFAFYFLAAVIVCQVMCSAVGLHFPDELFLNNPGYVFQNTHEGGLSLRASGTFSESSFAGAVLCMYCAAFLADFVQSGKGILRVGLAITSLFFVRSTSSLLIVPLMLALLVVKNPVISSRGFIRILKLRRFALLSFFVAIVLVAVFLSSVGHTAVASVAGKGDTSSFINRTAADIYGLQLLGLSHGLGVGLGSNRPSSLLASLLSNTGVAGCIAFLSMYLGIVKLNLGRASWLRWGALALLLDMSLGIPDISFATLWVILALIVRMSAGCRVPSMASHNAHVPLRQIDTSLSPGN